MKDMFPEHPSAERLQAFLDGDLSKSASAGTEEHLESCARCSSELDGWRLLFSKLGELEPSRPVEGFHDRVMAAVAIPEPRTSPCDFGTGWRQCCREIATSAPGRSTNCWKGCCLLDKCRASRHTSTLVGPVRRKSMRYASFSRSSTAWNGWCPPRTSPIKSWPTFASARLLLA